MVDRPRTISISGLTGTLDDAQVTRLSGREEISRPFRYDLEFVANPAGKTGPNDGCVDGDALLGKPVTLGITNTAGRTRYINGVIAEFAHVDYGDRFHTYRVVLRPNLWLLLHRSDCHVFENQTTVEIVATLFKRARNTVRFKQVLSAKYEPWDCRVQYDETDFDFISRLLEHEGIYYFFDHSEKDHELVLADDVATLSSAPGYDEVPYYAPGTQGSTDHLSSWTLSDSFQPGAAGGAEFNFDTPNTPQIGHERVAGRNSTDYEMFEYPVGARDPNVVGSFVRVRTQQYQSAGALLRGYGNAVGLCPGRLFKLKRYPRADLNKRYLIVATEISVSAPASETGGQNEEPKFSVSVEAVDATTPYRSPRRTPKPLIHGTQTALVVGPSEKEIWTDKYGRIKVKFHWQRAGSGGGGAGNSAAKKDNGEGGCWVRVAQSWAGKNWGAQYIPRVGQEVVVSFLDGDPDRPIVIGSVFNPLQMPPYALPDNATQSGLKSQSAPGGERGAANELRFEDKKDAEEIYLHAQKDMQVVVENNQTIKVGGDKKKEGNRTTTVANNDTLTVTKDLAVTVDGDERRTVKGKRATEVTGDDVVKVQSLKLEAKKEISLQVGPAKIVLKSDGTVEISGVEVTVKGDKSVDVNGSQMTVGGVEVSLKGTKTIVDGSATLDLTASGVASLKGSLTKIG